MFSNPTAPAIIAGLGTASLPILSAADQPWVVASIAVAVIGTLIWLLRSAEAERRERAQFFEKREIKRDEIIEGQASLIKDHTNAVTNLVTTTKELAIEVRRLQEKIEK
jgi:hypothetical protein